MKKKKAFTLIELLAVIIILGIVALIATPIVINVVENAQKKAFERSAQGYYDAARYVHNEMTLDEEQTNVMFTFENGVQTSDNSNYKLTVQGETPKKGLVYLSKNGQILVAIANDKWCAMTNGDGSIDLTDDPDACGYTPKECFTFSAFTLEDTGNGLSDLQEIKTQNLEFEGMDGRLLQVDSFDAENPSCKGIVIIPEEHNGKKVEGIKRQTFTSNNNITGLILPKEMKIINATAFGKASNLKQVILNEELRFIGNSAFSGTNLTEITIPEKVAYLGTQSFRYSNLKKVTILNPMLQVREQNGTKDYSPFDGKESKLGKNVIEEVVIGPNVKRIPNYFFNGNQIKQITIPSNVISIGQSAFANNQFPNAEAITILGDDPNRFDDVWEDIGFPAK